MGERFPAVKDREVIRVLKALGFEFYRPAKGSHEVWRRESDARHTVIPRHAGQTIKRRTLKAILEGAGLTVAEFQRMLRDK